MKCFVLIINTISLFKTVIVTDLTVSVVFLSNSKLISVDRISAESYLDSFVCSKTLEKNWLFYNF